MERGSISGAGYGRSTRHKGEVILSVDLLSRVRSSRGKACNDPAKSSLLRRLFVPLRGFDPPCVQSLSLSLSNLIYPELLLILIVTWIRVGCGESRYKERRDLRFSIRTILNIDARVLEKFADIKKNSGRKNK